MSGGFFRAARLEASRAAVSIGTEQDLAQDQKLGGAGRDAVPGPLLMRARDPHDDPPPKRALFAGFAGTIDESDFFAPFIIGYGLRPSRCGPGNGFPGQNEDLPVPAQEMCVHAQGLMTAPAGVN